VPSLSEFEKHLRQEVTRFAHEWHMSNFKDPDSYPMEMNSEDWLEQWHAFQGGFM